MTEKENEVELEQLAGSELPLVTRDETPPLLLDLPDGQQLVVGKLPDGIVIEIATWRGTGRPDSRTNRLMLGVSYDEDDEAVEPTKKKIFTPRKKAAELPVERAVIEDVPAETVVIEDIPAETIEIQQVPAETIAAEGVPVETIEELDLAAIVAIDDEHPHVVLIEHTREAQLAENEVQPQELQPQDVVVTNNRNMQDLFGARPRAQSDYESNTSKLDNKAHEIVKKENAVRNFQIQPKKLLRWAGYTVGVALTIYLIAGPGQISITHPEKGINTSLSSAKNALVIVRASDSYAVGDNVVANVEEEGNPAVFASIAATSDTEYVLTQNNLYHTTLQSEVKGKAILVVPGLGFLAGLLGL
jgi:hypothetical protein